MRFLRRDGFLSEREIYGRVKNVVGLVGLSFLRTGGADEGAELFSAHTCTIFTYISAIISFSTEDNCYIFFKYFFG